MINISNELQKSETNSLKKLDYSYKLNEKIDNKIN